MIIGQYRNGTPIREGDIVRVVSAVHPATFYLDAVEGSRDFFPSANLERGSVLTVLGSRSREGAWIRALDSEGRCGWISTWAVVPLDSPDG